MTEFSKAGNSRPTTRKRKTPEAEPVLEVVLEERPDTRAFAYLCTLPGEDGELACKYKTKLLKCRGRVKYTLTPDSRDTADGRLYADGGMMQNLLSSRLVNVMMSAKTSDVDFVNCQPTLLVQFAAKNGWACPAWVAYVQNRDQILQLIMSHASVGRDQAKKDIVAILYGAKGSSLVPPDLKQALANEAHILMRNVCLLYPDIVKSARLKNPDNVEGSVMARVLQTEERKCLLALRTFLASEGYEFAVLKHDGGLVYRKPDETQFPDGLLLRAEAYIQRVTTYRMDLVVKPMLTTITVPDDYIEPPPLPSLLEEKASFERFHAKVDSFYVVLGDGEGGGFGWARYERANMIERYRHIMYLNDAYEDGPRQEMFITAWMDHPDVRRYVSMDMYPPGCEIPCPPNVLNTWLGFAAERLPLLQDHEQKPAAAGAQLVLDHMRLIECNGDENLFKYRLGWWAHLYQFPGRKPRVGSILVGQKGAGKDTTVRAHLPLIGRHLICQTRVVDHILGTFNSAIDDKLLLWVEELTLAPTGGAGTNLMDGAKALITSEVQQITVKHKESVCKPSYHRFIGTTNERRSVPMTSDNRHFCLVEVSDAQRNNSQYFDALYAAMNDTKVQRWLFDFFKNPQLLENWISTAFPVTDELRANARASQPQEVLFAMHLCETNTGTQKFTNDQLYDNYCTWHSQQRLQAKLYAKTHLSNYLNDKGLLRKVAVDERTMASRIKRIDFDAWREALVAASIMTPQEALESAAAARVSLSA